MAEEQSDPPVLWKQENLKQSPVNPRTKMRLLLGKKALKNFKQPLKATSKLAAPVTTLHILS